VKALVFHEPGRLEVADVEERSPGIGELRVRVTFAGVCGTDRRILAGTKAVHGPRIIGHEFAGIVDVVGPGVAEWKPGDRVAIYPIITCGTCHACREGRKNICVRRRTFGYEVDGGFAESVIIVPEAVTGGNLVRVPDSVADIDAGASEPVAAALQGVIRAGVRIGDTVLILGAGPIGVSHIELSLLFGAAAVVVSEPDGDRRAGAARHGATHVLDPADGPLPEQLRHIVGSEGPRIAFVDAGVPSLIAEGLQAVRKGGRCVIFAGMPTGTSIALDPNAIHYGEVDLIGSSGSTPELLAQVLRWAAQGRLNLNSLVSAVLPLEEWQEAFGSPTSSNGLKVLFGLARAPSALP
jgi:L-iditol 2-dehydrogenase